MTIPMATLTKATMSTLGGRFRRPPLGRHGRPVVMFLCSYEVAAIYPRSPLPTLSKIVKRYPVVGIVLITLLVHHWFLELEYLEQDITNAIEDAMEAMS